MGYKENLAIDKYALDIELEKQPTLYMMYAEDAANAGLDKDRLKERVEIVKAETELKIRANPEKYDIVKVTEALIKAKVIMDKGVQAITNEYLEAVRDEKILNTAKSAFDHKKKALENLVQLHISGYFSEPKVQGEMKQEVSKTTKKEIVKTLNKKRRTK